MKLFARFWGPDDTVCQVRTPKIICPQEGRGEVATSDLVPLLLGTIEKVGVL